MRNLANTIETIILGRDPSLPALFLEPPEIRDVKLCDVSTYQRCRKQDGPLFRKIHRAPRPVRTVITVLKSMTASRHIERVSM